MCDDLSGTGDLDLGAELSDPLDTRENFADNEILDQPQESFEAAGIFDQPQEGISTPLDADAYTAATLDKTMILEENGDVHSIAERMAELEAENADVSAPSEPYEVKNLDEILILEEGGGVHTIAERMAELEAEDAASEALQPSRAEHIDYLTGLRDSLLAGDKSTLEMFGLDDPNSDAGGAQKVKTR